MSMKLRLEEGTGEYHITAKVASEEEENYIWIVGNRKLLLKTGRFLSLKNYEVPMNTTEFLIWIEPGEGTDVGGCYPGHLY